MSELTGAELDLAVAEAFGYVMGDHIANKDGVITHRIEDWHPSTNWAQGGPLIEEYDVNLSPGNDFRNKEYSEDVKWRAVMMGIKSDDTLFEVFKYGPTPLIAACRALVASKEAKE